MNPDVPAACLPALIRASSVGTSFPLVCPCGGDVELAGTGYGGAVRCGRCATVHASLATLVRAGTTKTVATAESKRDRRRAAWLVRAGAR